MDKIFYWVLAFLPGLIYPFLGYTYRRTLSRKRNEIETLITRGETLPRYIRAYKSETPASFDAISEDEKSEIAINVVKDMFEQHYDWREYVLPIAVTMLVVAASVAITLILVGIRMGLPTDLESVIARVPKSVIAGIAGAYVWGLHDVLRRYRSIDLYPASLHFIWLRLIIVVALSYLAGLTFTEPINLFAAFGIGTFPLKTLRDFTTGEARKRFGIGVEAVPGEEPNLHHIQGLTPKIINRLSEEEIYSTEHLANADPIKLLLRTNFEWKVILDIIDQAILFNYTGERITTLRTLGVRGAIELAEIGTNLQISDDEEAKEQAERMISTIASTLEVDEHVVKQLMSTLIEDPQLDFIWTLWGEAFEEQPSE